MPHKDKAVAKEYFKKYYKEKKEKLDEYRTAYRAANKEKERSWQDTYRQSSTEKRQEWARMYRYNISPEDFQGMLEAQQGACACCFSPFTKTPHIDHDHTTGKVRGLLCSPCNTGLGVYERRQQMFKEYLSIYGEG